MELLYEMRNPSSGGNYSSGSASSSSIREKLKSQYKYPCALAVSAKNLIAFTSPLNLLKKNYGKNGQVSSLAEAGGMHVYVADLNTPWDCYLVKNSHFEITGLSWSIKGELMVASADGTIGVYEMSENILNEWKLSYEHVFPGEPVIASCWLQFPKKICLNPEKLDSMLYSEKYDIRQIPNKSGFGGKSLEGILVVTATGLLGALIRSPEDPSKIIPCLSKLLAVRTRLCCVDTCYSKDGNIYVVSSCGKINQPVQLNRVNIKLVGSRDRGEITVKPAQSFFLPTLSDTYVSNIRFASSINPDTLLVALTNKETMCSVVCLYELVHHPMQLKGRFQSSTELIPTFKWQQSAQIQMGSGIQDLCTVALPISTASSGVGGSQLSHNVCVNAVVQPVVAVALSNGSIQLIRQDNLQQIGLVPPKHIKREIDDSPERKQMKFNGPLSVFNGLKFSWSGSILVALDNNYTFSIFKMHPNIDASTATSLLELSVVGGFDPWDILMCIRQNLVENIVDRLSETFARQPPPVQCYYNVKILVLKAALYRLAIGGLTRSNDQQTLLTLNLVSGALKALLRPSGLSSMDKGPAEALSALLSSKGESLSDVDQVLLHSEAKKYTVETSTLQSLQPFLQWCADLALKLLAILPDLRHSRAALWEVCRDSKAVGTLRELIVLMRIWGLICKSCLPSFRRTSENVDILPMLFRLLTRLSVAPHDPDETLIVPAEVIHPPDLAVTATPVREHYIWLWVCLGFGGIAMLIITFYLWYYDKKPKPGEERLPPQFSPQEKRSFSRSDRDHFHSATPAHKRKEEGSDSGREKSEDEYFTPDELIGNAALLLRKVRHTERHPMSYGSYIPSTYQLTNDTRNSWRVNPFDEEGDILERNDSIFESYDIFGTSPGDRKFSSDGVGVVTKVDVEKGRESLDVPVSDMSKDSDTRRGSGLAEGQVSGEKLRRASLFDVLKEKVRRMSVVADKDVGEEELKDIGNDCCLLPSEVQIPAYNSLSPVKNHGLASSSMLSRNSSFLQFEFGSNPLKWHVSTEDSIGTWMDGLRLLWLGKNPSGVKVCNRCGIATLIHLPPRSAANKAWDNRWLRSCPCGGHWKVPNYLPQPKVIDADVFLNL